MSEYCNQPVDHPPPLCCYTTEDLAALQCLSLIFAWSDIATLAAAAYLPPHSWVTTFNNFQIARVLQTRAFLDYTPQMFSLYLSIAAHCSSARANAATCSPILFSLRTPHLATVPPAAGRPSCFTTDPLYTSRISKPPFSLF